MKILITGDFVIRTTYNTSQIDKELLELFQESNFNVVNLEAPITKCNTKIIKTGPHLKSDAKSTFSVLKALNINLVTLANNHVLDYTEKGVLDTIAFCNENLIKTIGAGENKEESSRILYKDTEEGKIAFINIAENEWASATNTSAGANGMDLIDDIKRIHQAKKNADFVFVIVHGGHEYYNLPSPRLQKQYRFYIENGADLVIGHHPHCISGKEVYQGKNIYYSLGNFLFTKKSKYEDWYQGIVLEISISNGESIEVNEIFIEQDKNDFSLSFIKDKKLNEIKNRFKEYSDIIFDEKKLLSNWQIYLDKRSVIYNNYFSPISFIHNRYVKYLLQKLGFGNLNLRFKVLLLNILRCESHNDISKQILLKKLNENSNT